MAMRYAMFSSSLESSEIAPNMVELGTSETLAVRGRCGDEILFQ